MQGRIAIDNEYSFSWMKDNENAEVYGWIDRTWSEHFREIQPGTSGWYRTTDPTEAMKIAILSWNRPVSSPV